MKKLLLILAIVLNFVGKTKAQINRDEKFASKDMITDTGWGSEYLSKMKEPLLYPDTSGNEIYRFTWIRSFHNPIAVRIEKRDNNYRLYWKVLGSNGGSRVEKPIVDTQKNIDQPIWEQFKEKLQQAKFWRMTTKEAPRHDDNGNESFYLDGASWTLEARSINKYHVVHRTSPDKTSRFYKCCDYLIALTGLQISKDEKY